MHPFLSWAILLTAICAGYIALNGLPKFVQTASNARSRIDDTTTKKHKRRRDRQDRALKDDKQSEDDVVQASPKARNGDAFLQSSAREKPKSVTTKDVSMNGSNLSNGVQSVVVNGVQSSDVSANVPEDAPSQRPRTLKIVDSTNTSSASKTATQKPVKGDQSLTKKQRQNAAKRQKQKEEKALQDERQSAALKAHQKTLQTRRMQELKPVHPTTTGSAWTDNDWETVSKSRKAPNNGASTNTSEGDGLIW